MNIFFLQVDSLAHKFTDNAYNWLVTVGPKIVVAVIALFIGLWLIRLLNRWLLKILSNKRVDSTIRVFLENLFHIVLLVLLVLGLMQILGIQMTIFAAVIAAFGVAAGLALSGTLQNFASGVLIIMLKPFRVGDNISTQGQEGTVTSIKLFYTTILTYSNTTVIVPNSKLSNEVIFNLSRQGKRRLDIQIKLNYGVDENKMRSLIEEAFKETKDCLKEPPHRIGIEKMEIDGFTMMINVWLNSHGFEDTRLQLQEKILNKIKGSGVKLPGMV